MLQPFFDMIERLIEEFSWRRLLLILFLICLVVLSVVSYEWYTSHFELARIEKSIDLLAKLEKLQITADTSEGKNLKPIYEALATQLNAAVNPSRRGLGISVSGGKAITGALPWLLLAFVFLPGVLRREGNTVGGLVLVLIFGCIFGAANWWLPTFESLWINFLAAPVGFFISAIFLVVAWSQLFGKSQG